MIATHSMWLLNDCNVISVIKKLGFKNYFILINLIGHPIGQLGL